MTDNTSLPKTEISQITLSNEAIEALSSPELLAERIIFDHAPLYDGFYNPDYTWFVDLGGKEYSSGIYLGEEQIGHYTAIYMPRVERDNHPTIEEHLAIDVHPLADISSVTIGSDVRKAVHCLSRRDLLNRLDDCIGMSVPVQDTDEPYVGHSVLNYLNEVIMQQADLNLLEK